jgi:hypothetical protein
VTTANDEFEAFRGDLIVYLAAKLHLSHEDVVAKLGDLLVEQLAGVAEARRADTASRFVRTVNLRR